jgi:hypothetical protein
LNNEREVEMTERGKAIWRVAALVFTVVNLIGIGMAVAAGEQIHSGVHVALALVGAAAAWRLGSRSATFGTVNAAIDDGRLEQLQQSIDAIALEVERIGEAQRFHAKLQSERSETAR